MQKATLIIPNSIDPERHALDFPPSELCIFIPYPDQKNDEEIKGIYCNLSNIAALLRVNKNNPVAISYIADMLS